MASNYPHINDILFSACDYACERIVAPSHVVINNHVTRSFVPTNAVTCVIRTPFSRTDVEVNGSSWFKSQLTGMVAELIDVVRKFETYGDLTFVEHPRARSDSRVGWATKYGYSFWAMHELDVIRYVDWIAIGTIFTAKRRPESMVNLIKGTGIAAQYYGTRPKKRSGLNWL